MCDSVWILHQLIDGVGVSRWMKVGVPEGPGTGTTTYRRDLSDRLLSACLSLTKPHTSLYFYIYYLS